MDVQFSLGFQRTKRFAKICENFCSHFANFAFFRENKAKFRENNFRKNGECENFVKTMSVLAATINCSKELVEFSTLIPQNLKFYYSHINNFSSFTLKNV